MSMGERTESFLQKKRLHLLLIIFLGLAVYSNTFRVPFYFDDTEIVDNVRIRDITNIPSLFTKTSGPYASRPLMNATFAVNYWMDGFNTRGYHAVNLALHIANGMLLYLLVTMTGRHLGREEKETIPVALISSLIFVLHPVQTETVTNIVNRSMLLATAFYLSGLILFLNALTSKRIFIYMAGLFILSFLGIASRENFVTFPLLLLLFDLLFISQFSLKKAASHYKVYLPAVLGTAYIFNLTLGHTYDISDKGIPAGEYILTQFNVHFTYLRLLIFPLNQNLDYHYRIAKTLLELPTLLSFIGYIGLWAFGIACARRRPVTGFTVLWFFITLLPISFLSAAMNLRLGDVLFEHRLYLPSVGIFVLVAYALLHLSKSRQKTLLAFSFAIAIVFGGAAYARNAIWSDGFSLWSDVIKKAPRKARGYGNLALTYKSAGDINKAVEIYKIAIAINPKFADAHNNLGTIYSEAGLTSQAIEHFEIAIMLEPENVTAHFNLATLHINAQPEKAREHFKEALKIEPEFYQAHYNLALLYLKEGNTDEAIEHLEKVILLRPDFVRGYFNLGRTYSAKGLHQRAIEYYLIALRYRPYDPYLHRILADAYKATGDESKEQEYLIKSEALEKAAGTQTAR